VQLGKALGAHVIAVVSDADRAAFCREMGADETIVHRDVEVASSLRELTGGRGVDLVYDPVGGTLAEQAATAMARSGRFLAIGFASGRWPELPVHHLVMTNTSLVGVIAAGQSPEELRAIHAQLAGLVSDGRLRNAVTNEVAFDELPHALQRMGANGVVGKQVMVP
jgi:NADPH2:quinone reductase